MCGIAGYLLMGGGAVPDLAAMTAALVHRGPDDGGLFAGEGVGLGHRRLAIVDPSPAGHQPMLSGEDGLALTFNGEIYNFRALRAELEALGHRFRSATDTEVVLAAYRQWGVACLERFNGMWSFALWDAPRRRLVCARDRFGVKPFVYAEHDGRLLFASEPKALLAAVPDLRRIDRIALYRCLVHSLSGDGERSFYRDIRLLPAAHMLLVEDGRLSVRRYWDYPAPDPDLAAARPEIVAERVRELLVDAVRLRVPGDVQAGVTLSGGLDSSAIAALLTGLHPGRPVPAFSAAFPGDPYDEGPKIRAFAARTGLALDIAPQGATECGRICGRRSAPWTGRWCRPPLSLCCG
jgi:asparagine synthase (glutamine-hydrolysing)